MSPSPRVETEEIRADESVQRRTFSNPFLALYRAFALITMTSVEMAICMIRCVGRDDEGLLALARTVGVTWPRHCLYWMGIRVTVVGNLPPKPALLCPNHSGYVDILALGSTCHTFFIARADVESWPGVGRVFKMGRHLSIKRQKRSAVMQANQEIATRLEKGYRVCAFLEGTSTGHGGVLPFHASLLQAAIDAQVPVVPVGIQWRSRNDDVDPGEDVAYWKEHVFASHLFRLLGLSGVEAVIHFGEPITFEGQDRKTLAKELHRHVVELSGLSK